MKVEILQAKPSESLIISQLGKKTFRDTFQAFFNRQDELEAYLDYTFAPEKIAASLTRPQNSFWLAWADNQAVGYLKTKRNSRQEALTTENQLQLQKIYVLQAYLSQKVGWHLWEKALQQAQEENFASIWLTVFKPNERAIQFYQKVGFRVGGEHTYTIGTQTFDFYWFFNNLE